MASITIRNLDDHLKHRLRVQAAEHGRSMEEEVRDILRKAVGKSPASANFGEIIHRRFAALGGWIPLTTARTHARTAALRLIHIHHDPN